MISRMIATIGVCMFLVVGSCTTERDGIIVERQSLEVNEGLIQLAQLFINKE